MTKTQSFVAAICALAAGVGLVVAGGLTGNEAMVVSGTGLIGLFAGAVGLKRPQDA